MHSDPDWLYVPGKDLELALAMGAVFHVGDARLSIPRRMPPGYCVEDYAVWRTRGAVLVWLQEQAAMILNSLSSRRSTPETANDPSDDGRDASEDTRIYLHVPRADMPRARSIEGVEWDRGERCFYVRHGAVDLNLLAEWMTPAARRAWESERLISAMSSHLVRKQAQSAEELHNIEDGGASAMNERSPERSTGKARGHSS